MTYIYVCACVHVRARICVRVYVWYGARDWIQDLVHARHKSTSSLPLTHTPSCISGERYCLTQPWWVSVILWVQQRLGQLPSTWDKACKVPNTYKWTIHTYCYTYSVEFRGGPMANVLSLKWVSLLSIQQVKGEKNRFQRANREKQR